jgi:hypothetical protein
MEGHTTVVKIDSDCMTDILYAIEELGKRDDEPGEPALDLRAILSTIAQRMDNRKKNYRTIDIYFYADPTQSDLDGFRVRLTDDGGDALVFLPVKIFSLVEYISPPMLEACMSSYETNNKKNSALMALHNTICFFDPIWIAEKKSIRCLVWWTEFGECLIKSLSKDATGCGGEYQRVCECIQHVCSAHLHLIELPSKCQICSKPYAIAGPKFKKIKT